ncbi:HlyD family efflux transporter periplasmic adaptor subunit [Methylobacterium sp. J-059]|uniref:HlyD family efflux transporter periplasmic adaptor subunit n=1 Tax=Methylobacterium sp. J-059 TaxID=2836643 RepID=UPI001FBB92AC|nr:HlyD family efflux transporter periplasmic adaptor subunit [Methylobacterium sp. J-059]MCJ2038382.1 HlyD family efflux transporter periplasmic adaptor subunit [Methylobacterium sp. J-059]
MSNRASGDLGDHPRPPAPTQGAAKRLALLESALWQQLQGARTLVETARSWLAFQGRMLPAASRGLVLVTESTGGLTLLAAWPEGGDRGATDPLRDAAERALREGRPVVQENDHVGPGADSRIAVPIAMDGAPFAVACLALTTTDRDELRAAIRQVQWGAPWLTDRAREERGASESRLLARSRAAFDLLASVLEQARFKAACMAAVTDLAIAFGGLRAGIGFTRRGSVRVVAISHSAQFGQQMNLVRKLSACMDEALDQRTTILFPSPPGDAFATTAHAELARLQHGGQVLTVPLLVVDRFVGAITIERPSDAPFTPETVELVAATCAAIAPVLDEKRQNDRFIGTKVFEAVAGGFGKLVGHGHLGLKLWLGLALAAAAILSIATGPYRVTAEARIEGLVRRAVVVSFDGFLKEAPARAGDTVRRGALLAAMEDRDLALERLRWVTERQQRVYEYDKALAGRQPATINVVKSQIDQAEAQIKLIDEQLSRTKLFAPFDGLVVSGDLSQQIGGSVSRGQVLYEIAPLDDYRVVIFVDERLIADVKVGQTGQMLASSLPNEPYPLTIDKITPVAEIKSGRNMFRVEGHIRARSTRLRPGMEGLAKIDIDNRLYAATYARPILDWARILVWHWQP